MQYTQTNTLAAGAGYAASAVAAGYRQRCEANWMLRNGVPLDDIQRRLVLTTRLRQAWGYWYVCIYCFFVLGAVAAGWANTLSAVLERFGLAETPCPAVPGWECRPTSLVGWPLLLAVGLLGVSFTWRSLRRINAVLSEGTGLTVPSWGAMAEGMVELPHDRITRSAVRWAAVLLLAVPHLLLAAAILSGTASVLA